MSSELKDKLRRLIKAGREKETADLVPHVDDSPPPQPGRWTAKDHLAHIATWRSRSAAELEGMRAGTAPRVFLADDVENANIYAETHDLPAGSVLDLGRSSWAALAEVMEAYSEEDLLKSRQRRPEEPAWQVVANPTLLHLPEHLGYSYIDRGDDVAKVVAVATWAHELAAATLPDSTLNAAVEYNLACVYARGGRAALAMPHLRSAFGGDQALREWAKQDTDLDPIRSDPELVRLLA